MRLKYKKNYYNSDVEDIVNIEKYCDKLQDNINKYLLNLDDIFSSENLDDIEYENFEEYTNFQKTNLYNYINDCIYSEVCDHINFINLKWGNVVSIMKDRKNDNIIKLDWQHNSQRTHIHLHKDELKKDVLIKQLKNLNFHLEDTVKRGVCDLFTEKELKKEITKLKKQIKYIKSKTDKMGENDILVKFYCTVCS